MSAIALSGSGPLQFVAIGAQLVPTAIELLSKLCSWSWWIEKLGSLAAGQVERRNAEVFRVYYVTEEGHQLDSDVVGMVAKYETMPSIPQITGVWVHLGVSSVVKSDEDLLRLAIMREFVENGAVAVHIIGEYCVGLLAKIPHDPRLEIMIKGGAHAEIYLNRYVP